MARGKRGLNARTQHRNSLGQFAVREVICIIDDESDVLSEVRVPRGKRFKGESSTPTPAKKILNLGNKGKNKFHMQRRS